MNKQPTPVLHSTINVCRCAGLLLKDKNFKPILKFTLFYPVFPARAINQITRQLFEVLAATPVSCSALDDGAKEVKMDDFIEVQSKSKIEKEFVHKNNNSLYTFLNFIREKS